MKSKFIEHLIKDDDKLTITGLQLRDWKGMIKHETIKNIKKSLDECKEYELWDSDNKRRIMISKSEFKSKLEEKNE